MRFPAILFVFSLVVLSLSSAWGHAPRNTLVTPGEHRYPASADPDRVILVADQHPWRSQTVNWRTNHAVTEAVAQITEAHDTPGLHLTARTVTGTVRPRTTENGLAHHHSVTFDDLRPDTLYAYRVRGQGTWSEWFQFRTAKRGFAPFTFFYFGDAQNSVRSHFSRVIREAFMEHARPALMLHAGDLVNLRAGIHDDEWGEWFEAGGFLHAMVPSIPVTGNHEFVNEEDADGNRIRVLSHLWEAQFTVPGNGPPGLRDTVYFVEHQGVLFIVLDSTRALEDESLAILQAEWLEQRLRENTHRWVIVSHHHPMQSVSLGRDNPILREHWQPLYQRYGVDLVLQGHDHTYGRGANVPEGSTLVDNEVGTVYVVSVAGPKMYLVSEEAREEMTRVGEEVQLYQVIAVEEDRLRFESRTVSGQLYDAFDIRRLQDGRNALVDRMPPGMLERICTNPSRPRPTRCWEGTELVD